MSKIPVQSPSVVTCPDLDDPDDGSVNYDDVEVGSTAEYSCNEEFDLVGENSRVCHRWMVLGVERHQHARDVSGCVCVLCTHVYM